MENRNAEALVNAMSDLNEMKVLELVVDLVTADVSAYAIFETLLEGIRAVDRRYEAGEYFIADLIMAGHIMSSVMRSVLFFPGFEEFSSFGSVLIATVSGDIHELGKQVVAEVLQHNGFTVRDLGADVPAERITAAIAQDAPNILILSGTLSASAEQMRRSIRAVEATGLRGGLHILVGGPAAAGLDPAALGADARGDTVLDCLRICHEFMALTAGGR